MVLKKPYAFLIKHFRAIHLCLLIPMLYLIIKTKGIVGFFSDYILSGYSVNFTSVLSNLSSYYINIFMYLSVILVLGTLISISLLLQKKDKPTKIYNVSIIYYLFIFILITASFSIFRMIEEDILSDVMARLIRDLSYIIHYSQYIFVVLILVRGVGFNIKKFNFKDDLRDLEISSEDSEEFEFLVGHDTYKTKRTIRRFFRELKYYYKENKFIFTIIFIVIIASIGTFIYMNRGVYQRVYKKNESIAFGYLNVTLKDAYITNLDKNGNVLDKDKSYFVIKINMRNRYSEDREFNYTNFQLLAGKDYILPNISIGEYFSDFGNPFNGSFVKGNADQDFIMVYELNRSQVSSNFSLMAYSSFDNTIGGLGAINREISVYPTILNSSVINNNVNKATNLDLKSTNLGATTVSILDYELTNRFEYPYKYCVTPDNCIDSVDAVTVNYGTDRNQTLLVLDYRLELDPDSSYMYASKTFKTFFEDFLKIKYTYNGKEYYTNVAVINPASYSDKMIMKISDNINDATSIEAVITIRNISYSVKLK